MMKIQLIAAINLFCFGVTAQEDQAPMEVHWAGIEYPVTNEVKLELLGGINEDLFYFLKDNEQFKSSLDNFHFLDLNGDKTLDFIYVGYAGGEQPSTIAFTQNSNGYFKRVFEALGVIYELSRVGLVEGALMFKVLKNDECYDCLGVKNSITYIGMSGAFTEVERLNFTDNTDLPEIVFKRQFKVINPVYYLRSTPIVMNDGTGPDTLFGNVVAEFVSGAEGYAFASKEDNTGRVWWFVAMKSDESQKAIFQEKRGYHLGWMSSRYLEEL